METNNCHFCDFRLEADTWDITLYQSNSYKYEGFKYFLEVEYPLGEYLTKYPRIKPVEVHYCPMCGRKLNA